MTALKSLVTQNGTTQQIGNGDSLLVGTGIDRNTAGALTIGGTTATSITLGSATIPVNIPGDVTTVGGTTFTTDATFEGNVTFGAGPADTVTFAALTTVNSNINFAGGSPTYKITNLANGTNPNDAVNYSQLSALVTGVSSFQTSLSGLTPSSATGGAVTLAGTLGVTSGGTGASTAFTQGSVVFAGASGVYAQDNANLFWDDTANALYLGPRGSVVTSVGYPFNTVAEGASNAALAAWTFGNASPSSAAKMAMERARGTAASPSALAAGDVIGEIIFNGYTDQRVGAAQILGYAATGWGASGSDAPGNLWFLTSSDGSATPTQRFAINAGVEAVFNDPQNNFDFRVASQANANMLLVDASQGSVSIGTSGNTHTFNVGSGSSANFCVASGGRIHTYDGTAPLDGQVLIGDTASGNFAKATISAGTGISITNGAGSITIAATGAAASTSVAIDMNTSGVSVGAACYVSASGVVSGASASAPAAPYRAARVVGIASTSAASGKVVVSGKANATFVGSLTIAAGDPVYLSLTTGQLTNNVSAFASGDAIAEVGLVTSTLTYNGTSDFTVEVALQPKAITIL